jgi:hypothetical protein
MSGKVMERNGLEMWVVYERPKDFPDKYVARKWLIDRGGITPTKLGFVRDSLEELRDYLVSNVPGLHRMDRQPGDDPCIVEVWF